LHYATNDNGADYLPRSGINAITGITGITGDSVIGGPRR